MKSIISVAFVFFVVILATSCTKDEDSVATDRTEQKSGDNDGNNQGNPGSGSNNGSSSMSGINAEVTVSNGQLRIELYNAFAQKESKHEGVVVEITGAGKTAYKATSDNSGLCRFNGLPDGKYTAVMAKSGYYCPPVSGGTVKLYQKAKGYVSGLTFYQRPEGIAFKAKLNDIAIPSDVTKITIRFFVSKSQDVSKTNFGFEGNKTGVSTMIIDVPVSSIKNGEIDHRNARLCGWRDALQGTGTYMTCYIASTYQIVNGNFDENRSDNDNSGLGAVKSENYSCR